ncbi:MAG: OmpP1/FadL family transporter [Armatimonadota bacterium]
MRLNLVGFRGGVLLVAGVLLLGLCTPGAASSFRSNGLGARARGMGGAYVAIADDTTAGYWNPAGLAFTNGRLTQLEMKFDSIDAEYTPPGGSPEHNIPQTLFVPALGTNIPLHQDSVPTLEILGYVPYGFELEWDENAAYRYNTTFNEIRVLSLGMATAVKTGDRFAVGVGAFVNEGKVTLDNKVPSTVYAGTPDLPDATFSAIGKDTSPNYHAGALWQANKTLRIGATYRAPIDLTIRGDADLTIPGGPVTSDQWVMPLELPQSVSLGFAWQATPVILVAGQADWVAWSSIDRQVITFQQGALPNVEIARHWKDRVQLRAGVEYTALKPFSIRVGYSYDPTPVPDTTLDPLLMDTNRHILSAGIGVSQGNWTLDLSYEHFFSNPRTTTTSIHPFPTNGTYSGNVNIFVCTVSYRM